VKTELYSGGVEYHFPLTKPNLCLHFPQNLLFLQLCISVPKNDKVIVFTFIAWNCHRWCNRWRPLFLGPYI